MKTMERAAVKKLATIGGTNVDDLSAGDLMCRRSDSAPKLEYKIVETRRNSTKKQLVVEVAHGTWLAVAH